MPADVLVVDDEPGIRGLLTAIFRLDDYDVRAAASGLEALQEFQRVEPDLVVLDMMMPGMDGLEVCRRLRSLSSVRILAITGAPESHYKERALEAGADDFMTKPFNPFELLEHAKASLGD